MAVKNTIAKRLRKLRGEMSQTEFARRFFGVSLRTYQYWETDPKANITGPVLKLIAIYEKNGMS